jgi:LysR family transcriptional regulator, low CO2-responsive transcriptional regulator
MTLRQLEIFLAVAREKSFSLAAKKIHLSQPTLSEHISELESELGKQLFFRHGRHRVVKVTEAGRVFEQFAERAVLSVEGARQALADLDGLTHGSVLIGASTTPGLYVLPRMVAAFRTKYPGVDVKLQIANSQTIEGRVRERELDLGIVGGHALRPGQECLAAGMLDELVLIVSPTHAWAKRRDVTPESLVDEPLLVREEGSATRSVTERALQRVKFRVAMELDHTEAIKQGVMAGLGVAFVSLYAVQGEIAAGQLRVLPLRGLRIQRHFHVIHHEARRVTASARAFMELFEQTARGRSGLRHSRKRDHRPVH